MSFYSNGKLLITGEYLVLDGAKSLALPTKFGQNLEVKILKNEVKNPQLLWKSIDNDGKMWFKCIFNLPNFTFKNEYFSTENDLKIAKILQKSLQKVKEMNPFFLKSNTTYEFKTILNFNKNWGLGSSSTLINSLATFANVDAFKLQFHAFGGSAYDIACAQNNTPIFYSLIDNNPITEAVSFNPTFKDELYFVYLNKKKNSRIAVENYKKLSNQKKPIKVISEITEALIHQKNSKDFAKLLHEHEQIISKIIKIKTIKEQFFNDYFGEIKSLGAWEGDFILAVGNKNTPIYFKNKGFKTVIEYKKMIL